MKEKMPEAVPPEQINRNYGVNKEWQRRER